MNYDNASIKLNRRAKLTPVNQVKYLGMYIDKYLSWNFHINELSKKLSRANGILSKLRYNAPLETCLQVYYAIFYSHLIYGCNVWGLSTEGNINTIEVLQKKCVRILSFAPFKAHTNQLFIALGLLKVRDIIKCQQLKLVYDFYEKNMPTDLMTLFQSSAEAHTTDMNLNSNIKRLIHRIKTKTYGLKSIKYHCAELWNEFFKKGIAIDCERKNNISFDKLKSGKHFQKVLKRHYLYMYTLAEDDE